MVLQSIKQPGQLWAAQSVTSLHFLSLCNLRTQAAAPIWVSSEYEVQSGKICTLQHLPPLLGGISETRLRQWSSAFFLDPSFKLLKLRPSLKGLINEWIGSPGGQHFCLIQLNFNNEGDIFFDPSKSFIPKATWSSKAEPGPRPGLPVYSYSACLTNGTEQQLWWVLRIQQRTKPDIVPIIVELALWEETNINQVITSIVLKCITQCITLYLKRKLLGRLGGSVT